MSRELLGGPVDKTALSLPRVQSLVRKLRSHKLRDVAKEKKKHASTKWDCISLSS